MIAPYRYLLMFGLAMVLAGCGSSLAQAPQERGGGGGAAVRAEVGKASGSAAERMAEGIFAEVNAYRRGMGRRELRRHAGLDRLAREHSEYLRANRGTFRLHGRNVSHAGFEDRVLAARRLMRMESLAENVVAGNATGGIGARQLVDGWKRSPSHHKNLHQNWEYTGVGVAIGSDGHVFATQLYGTGAVKTSRWSGPQISY